LLQVAVLGGDFRSCIIARKLVEKGYKVYQFFSENKLGGFMRGVRVWDQILDPGPQYLDNFNDQDKTLIESFGSEAELIDLKFSYSNYIGGKVSEENMALPSWYNIFNLEKRIEILSERSILSLNYSPNNYKENTLSEFIDLTSGKFLKEYQDNLCEKFLGIRSKNIHSSSQEIIPFVSKRQALFEGNISKNLKLSLAKFDDTLAAPKALVTNSLYNLYPKYGYNCLLNAFEKSLLDIGVDLHKNTKILSIEKENKKFKLISENENIQKLLFDKVYIGFDERLYEKVLLNTNNLESSTVYIPQHFVYIEVPKGSLGNLNYIFNYDLNDITTRITDLYYNLNNSNKTILCAEVCANNKNLIRNEKDKEEIINKSLNEVQSISAKIKNSSQLLKVFKSECITVPKTYRIPRKDYYLKKEKINKEIFDKYGENLISFPYQLTRKLMLDSIKNI
tara:strand:- start:62 stop:1411 length:1350 start_codon:yes stop_codon:yes gene_type:complete